MAKTNSKSIGNNFERAFSRDLSLWATNGKDDDVFYRDLSSGARATTRKKQGKASSNDGDLVATDLNYKPLLDLFFIDTKSYKEINFMMINDKNIKSNSIFQQWLKVSSDCPDYKIPFMIVKIRDRKTPNFMMLPKGTKFNYTNIMKYKVVYNNVVYEFSMILQDEFFELNSYDSLIEENKL